MPYATGTAADYAALLTALRNACTSNGWTLTGNVLSKGTCYVNTEVITNLVNSGNGMPRLLIRAANDSSITDAATTRVGLGHYSNIAAQGVQFTCSYHVFVFDSPDEVYMVVVYNTNHHQWLAFGQSPAPGLPGTGNWASGTLSCGLNNNVSMSAVGGGNDDNRVTGNLLRTQIGYDGGGGGNADATCAALAWNTYEAGQVGNTVNNFQLHAGNVGQTTPLWLGVGAAQSPAIRSVQQLIQNTPSSWSSESLLVPIQPTFIVGSNVFNVAQIVHARYININNYAPGFVITIGSDQWMSFPWYLKGSGNTASSETPDSKVYGWAIRYDGP